SRRGTTIDASRISWLSLETDASARSPAWAHGVGREGAPSLAALAVRSLPSGPLGSWPAQTLRPDRARVVLHGRPTCEVPSSPPVPPGATLARGSPFRFE